MAYFRFNTLRCLCAIVTFLVGSLAAQGQTLHGTVTNGTSNKPAGGDDVVLIKLEKGMEEEARTKTDKNGAFTFNQTDLKAPHLLRVRHQNVNYLEPLKPGSNTVALNVYNAAARVAEIRLLDQSQIYETSGSQMRVIELLRFNNTSNPPITQPNFELTLPDGVQIDRAQAIAPSGMPIPSAPAPTANNKYLVSYPLRPGITQYELVYLLPYTGSYKALPNIELPADKFFVVTPKSLNFSSNGNAFHSDQWTIEPDLDVDTHAVDNPAPGQSYAFEVTGMGTLPQTASQQQAGRGQPADDNRPGIGLGVPNEGANPLSSGQWGFLGVLTLFMAGGAVFLFMMSNPAKATVAPAPAKGSATLLDALKEEMFQLEADRIHGKIATEEYNSAKAALDKTLQRAMKRATTN